MESLERVLNEKRSELLRALRGEAGLTADEAELFLREAGPALMESSEWQATNLDLAQMGSAGAVRDLLGGISGTTLATRVGLSEERTWDGLRVLIPAALRSSGSGNIDSEHSAPARFDIGFGLTLNQRPAEATDGHLVSGSRVRVAHPIFASLPTIRDRPAT